MPSTPTVEHVDLRNLSQPPVAWRLTKSYGFQSSDYTVQPDDQNSHAIRSAILTGVDNSREGWNDAIDSYKDYLAGSGQHGKENMYPERKALRLASISCAPIGSAECLCVARYVSRQMPYVRVRNSHVTLPWHYDLSAGTDNIPLKPVDGKIVPIMTDFGTQLISYACIYYRNNCPNLLEHMVDTINANEYIIAGLGKFPPKSLLFKGASVESSTNSILAGEETMSKTRWIIGYEIEYRKTMWERTVVNQEEADDKSSVTPDLIDMYPAKSWMSIPTSGRDTLRNFTSYGDNTKDDSAEEEEEKEED